MSQTPKTARDAEAIPAVVRPNRELGQNFLADLEVLAAEVAAAELSPADVVLEVGPGTGVLTRALAGAAKKVVAIELDRRFKPVLNDLVRDCPNVEVIWGDATEVEFPPFDKVVANLPYKVALPLLFRFLESSFCSGVVMVQEDLARRVCAGPGERGYGAVAAALQRLGRLSVLRAVPGSAFDPPPDVGSALLRIVPEVEPFRVPSAEQFRRVLDNLFLRREEKLESWVKRNVPPTLVGRALGLLRRDVRRKRIAEVEPAELGQVAVALDRLGIELPAVSNEAKRTAQRVHKEEEENHGLHGWPGCGKSADQVMAGLLVFRGLAELALRELAARGVSWTGAASASLRGHELLVGHIPAGQVRRLADLRTVEDLFAVCVAERRVRLAQDLRDLAGAWSREDFLSGLRLKGEVFGKPHPRRKHTCAVFVKADRDRRIHRKDIAAALAKVPAAMRNWAIADPGDAEVWGFFSGEKVTAGVRLTTNDFRARPELKRARKGALRPTIAAAMAMAAPLPGEGVALDPMCGVGTVLYEYGRCHPGVALVGVDIDPAAVSLARENLAKAPGARVVCGDARRLELPDGSVDRLLCNLPFGRVFSSEEENAALYPALAREFARVLKPDGMMVLLTGDSGAFRRSFGADPALSCRVVARVDVLGVDAEIVEVRRRKV